MLVEDDPAIAQQVHEAVPEFVDPPDAARATVCSTFEEAQEILSRERFDLLISDIGLPDCSGLEVMETLSRRFGLRGRVGRRRRRRIG